jgi:acyl phosphate:glycerol-3-phosphate acyltransferase
MAWVQQLQSANWGQVAIYALGAYVLGCFATGYYLVRALRGRDIRNVDSGSVGARNVSQVLGRRGFVLTTLGDIAKGVLAVSAARHLTGDDLLAGAVMLAVTAGHIWPAQLRFHGGKGVATSLGALLIYDWRLAMTYVLVFLGGFALTRKTVLPGLFAYVCLPVAAYWLNPDGLNAAVIALLGALVLVAHRRNIVEEFPALAARCGVVAKPEQPKL